MEQEGLWRQVISVKFRADSLGWYPKLVTSSHGSSLWRSISIKNEPFYKFFTLKIGNGTLTSSGRTSGVMKVPFVLLPRFI